MVIFLSIFLPLFYLGASTQWARFVSRTTRANTEDERFMHAILVGVFWPVTIPFYLALHESQEQHYYRELDKREERADLERMVYRSLEKGRNHE